MDRQKAINAIARRQYLDLHGEVSHAELEARLAPKSDAELAQLLEDVRAPSRVKKILQQSAREKRWPRGPR